MGEENFCRIPEYVPVRDGAFFLPHPFFCFVGLPEVHHQVWGEDRKKKNVSECYQSITLVYVAGKVIN